MKPTSRLSQRLKSAAIFALAIGMSPGAVFADELQSAFEHPPAEARPWVYWFWNNGNVTITGITADLEAMQRVGIGGVLIMDVVERFAPPRGTADFMNEEWQRNFQHTLKEAARLGLEVNMNNGPGWCGSSGAWITPDLSMQKLAWSDLTTSGPAHFNRVLAKPDTSQKQKQGSDIHQDGGVEFQDNYHDIAVLAFPKPANANVPRESVMDLTSKLEPDGRLDWEVPAGEWIIQRIGHTTTGSSTRPPVAGGSGLECDKLSREAMDAHFGGMIGRLAAAAGPLAGKTLTATHIDSWEVGGQNWTPKLRDEFLKRRGYDPLLFLPSLLGGVRDKAGIRYPRHVGGAGLANRFRWDFDQTVSELLADHYAGRLADLAHQHGMRLSIEGYNLRQFGDEATYAARADEPMGEFWTPSEYGAQVTLMKSRQVASVAHTMGRSVVGAEAFTSGIAEMWKQHPATIKILGDSQFCQGINRFVFHRYQHQPYTDRVPGATMGPWGLHYERTQTWWEMSGAWHEYLTRCQFMLRQGLFVADLCYLRPETPNQTYFKPNPEPPAGYRYDEISAEALIGRMRVKDGLLTLPDGMNYRILVVPPARLMTPALARKLHELVTGGATVVAMGNRPQGAPGLQDFPQCDGQVINVAGKIWGHCDGKKITENRLGLGRLIRGRPLVQVLAEMKTRPDFSSTVEMNWIHRKTGDTEAYFVANPSNKPIEAACTFRVQGRQPELWDPETGECRDLPQFTESDGRTDCALKFGPSQAFFVVFRKPCAKVAAAANFPHWRAVARIEGPWQVRFPAKSGAPEMLTFANLVSWSEHADEGVKHFSGTARYSTTFEVANLKSRIMLDLGDVEVMARVKVNGRDCGIAWKPPFRVDVTGALKAGSNTLEIAVANLWSNRLIGDQSLPEDQRFTWTTWNPYQIDSPLMPSGLLGPVSLMAGE